jgi:hypothetical protein
VDVIKNIVSVLRLGDNQENACPLEALPNAPTASFKPAQAIVSSPEGNGWPRKVFICREPRHHQTHTV